MKFACYTLGCKVNQYETQAMEQLLMQSGHTLGSFDEICDGYIINTCTVTAVSDKKSRNAIRRVRKLNPNAVVGVCGCYAQSSPDEIRKLDVDVLIGTDGREAFVRHMIDAAQTRQKWDCVDDAGGPRAFEILPAGGLAARTRALLKVEDGCNNFCTYCIVPYVRGRERSRNPEDIIAECERLADDGVVEIMLLGQNVNSYGKNLEHPITFAELLRRVCAIEKIQRVRFMTSHPKDLSDELIDVIAENQKICRHLHLPVQSGSTKILNAMNRRYTKESYLALVDRIRAKVPEISLTTDIIVGFPGETEEDFLETMDVVEKVQYDTAFTFIYSKRTGTPAAGMENGSTKEEIQDRYNRLLRRVQEISDVKTIAIKGQTQPVLVEGFDEKGDGLLTGRLSNNILVHFPGCAEMVGKILNVKLVECKGFYYMGELAE